MKILALCGSPRRSHTRTGQLTKELLAGAAAAGAQTEYVDIGQLKLHFCLACDKCHELGHCVQKDDFEPFMEKVLAADGFVLASPVYCYQVSAQLKVFIDRLGRYIHCQKLLGKYGAVVATAGGDGQVQTTDYMSFMLLQLGAQTTGRLAVTLDEDGPVPADSPLLAQARQVGADLVGAITEKPEYPEQRQAQEGIRAYFCDVVNRRRDRWAAEYEYFKQQGWL